MTVVSDVVLGAVLLIGIMVLVPQLVAIAEMGASVADPFTGAIIRFGLPTLVLTLIVGLGVETIS